MQTQLSKMMNGWSSSPLLQVRLLGSFILMLVIIQLLFNSNNFNCTSKIIEMKESTSTTDHEPKADIDTSTNKMIVLVQGESQLFAAWHSLIRNVQSASSDIDLMLIYASFDKPIPLANNECHNNNSSSSTLWCHTAYIPNTTWTQGRNELAKMAYCQEEKQEEKFLYWVFSDDDSALHCLPPPPKDVNTNVSLSFSQASQGEECWHQYFQFLREASLMSNPPVTIPLSLPLTMPRILGGPNFLKKQLILTDTYDALVNAFYRPYVPFLLPYATLAPGTSEWLSQAAHFWVMQTCFPTSALTSYEMVAANPMHREYSKGLDPSDFAQVVYYNYANYFKKVQYPQQMAVQAQFEHVVQVSSFEEAAGHIQNQLESIHHAMSYCAPMKQRFDDWFHLWHNNTSICSLQYAI